MRLTILGLIFVISSLGQIRVIADYDWYAYCVGHLPPTLMAIRYAVSWGQRIIGLCIGVGLMARRRWAARLAIILSVFEILTVYWKFPLESFEKQALVWDKHFGWMLASFGEIHFASYSQQAVLLSCLVNILFFGFVCYYLTRPYVKEQLR